MPPASLHESLLHAAPAASEAAPDRRWAYPFAGVLLVSAALLYHLSVLVVWNGPGKDLAQPFASSFLAGSHGHAYFRATRNDQSWGMFAPNPDRFNTFVKVLVTDVHGEVWDFSQDIWAEPRHPYLWYDRRGKVNRNIDGKKQYQRMYGAWVCREWERQNAGEAPRSVQFVKRWTEVPHPDEVLAQGGWDPWAGPFKVFVQDTITCRRAEHGTLPNELRARYGLPTIAEGEFRPVEIETWVDNSSKSSK